MTFIPIDGKSKSYKHSLIIYWTALVCIAFNRRTAYTWHNIKHYKHKKLKWNVKMTNARLKETINGIKAERQRGNY